MSHTHSTYEETYGSLILCEGKQYQLWEEYFQHIEMILSPAFAG